MWFQRSSLRLSFSRNKTEKLPEKSAITLTVVIISPWSRRTRDGRAFSKSSQTASHLLTSKLSWYLVLQDSSNVSANSMAPAILSHPCDGLLLQTTRYPQKGAMYRTVCQSLLSQCQPFSLPRTFHSAPVHLVTVKTHFISQGFRKIHETLLDDAPHGHDRFSSPVHRSHSVCVMKQHL